MKVYASLAYKPSSCKVDGNFDSGTSNNERFIVEVMPNLKANRKSTNREELVKHITSEFTEFDEATNNNILNKLVIENKLIKKKYAEKICLVYPVPTIKLSLTKRILTLWIFKQE